MRMDIFDVSELLEVEMEEVQEEWEKEWEKPEEPKLFVRGSQCYRPGVYLLPLKGNWSFDIVVSESFEEPTNFFLEYLRDGAFQLVDPSHFAGKKPTIPVGPLFDSTKLHDKYILPICCAKEGNKWPFPCTSFSTVIGSSTNNATVFRIGAENAAGRLVRGGYLLICNNNLTDVASMHPFDRDRIEAALENLVYDATIAWKFLDSLPSLQKNELSSIFRFKEDRLNTALENDVLALFRHSDLKGAAAASFASKFGEMYGDEKVRLEAVQNQVQISAHGDDSQKVVRGLFFVFKGRISFCCRTDNSETRNMLFSFLDNPPGNLFEPRCEIALHDVIYCVNWGLFKVMPLQGHTGKRQPGRCHFPNLPNHIEILVERTRSRCQKDDDEDLEIKDQNGVKRFCNRENEEFDLRLM